MLKKIVRVQAARTANHDRGLGVKTRTHPLIHRKKVAVALALVIVNVNAKRAGTDRQVVPYYQLTGYRTV
jgi:hypothetical protein